MIKTVVREYHFKPGDIAGLFLDKEDYLGLNYWYEDAKQMNEELKKQ